MFNNVKTTPEAAKFADIFERVSAGQRKFLSYEERLVLVDYIRDLDAIVMAGLEGGKRVGSITGIIDQVANFWMTRAPHGDYVTAATHPRFHKLYLNVVASPLADFAVRDEVHRSRNITLEGEYLLSRVNTLLVDAKHSDISLQEFTRWAERFENWYLTMGGHRDLPDQFIWRNDLDLRLLDRFHSSRWDTARPILISLIVQKGHAPETVFKYGLDAAKFLTADQLATLEATASPKTVKTLLGLDRYGRQSLTPELLQELVNVGYQSGAEVKDYARAFGVPFTDMNFYTRLIRAKKLYPDLAAYTPAV